MNIGGLVGSIGTAIGSAASGVSTAAGGIEGRATLGVAGAASVSGLARFDTGPSLDSMFGPKMGPVSLPVNEGPAGFGGLIETMPLQIGQINPIKEIKFNSPTEGETISSVENFLAQVRMPQVEPMIMPEISPTEVPLVAPMLHSWEPVMPMEAPIARTVIEQAEEVAQKAWDSHMLTQTEQLVSSLDEESPAILPQPIPQEQEEKEEVITKKEIVEQIKTVEEEEVEKTELKDVVDEPVLSTRIEEFGHAAELAGTETEEIEGKKIVEKVGPETAKNRSGLVKKTGPDGSWIETIWAVASKKFRSVREAKDKIMAIIAEKVPVKKAKEGIAVGYEAVARVLKYFLLKLDRSK